MREADLRAGGLHLPALEGDGGGGPSTGDEQPYEAAVEGDRARLAGTLDHAPELLKCATEACDGITTQAFEEAVRGFFAEARHPTFVRPYTDVGYQPMRELVDLLHANGSGVHICSGGGRDFMRPVARAMYGTPRERVIGSATTLEYRDGDLYRARGVEMPIDDGPGKPVHAWTRTGRKPLLAGGDSDGGMAMLETARLGLLFHQDDAEREFAYDAGAERALAATAGRGWTVVGIRDDFATVFPR